MSTNPKKKKFMKTVFVILSALFLFACSTENSLEMNRQELMDADKAFSKLSSEEGMNHAFLSYCANDGVLLLEGSMPVVGHESVKNLIERSDDSGVKLTWEPIHAMVAESGDLGYTYGIFSRYAVALDSTIKGTYVSVWVKENGDWKFVLDSGNEGLGE